jgi:hypothetical protein
MRNVLLALATLLALTGALYWHGLSGDLVLDDAATLEPIARLAEGELTWHEALVQHDNFRPLSMASYVANWFVTGDGVWPLKLTNLVVHLICGVLVFLLSDRLLARPLAGVGQRRRWLALWIAACWLLAPLLVSTVLYVTQRMAALATLFSLAALLAYVCGRARIADGRAGGPGLIGIGLVVLWPLAVLSKENGILVPALALVVELFFFGGAQSRQDNRRALRVTAWCVAAAVLIGIVIATTTRSAVFLAYEYRSFTLVERVLTEWRILFDYLANLLLLPGGSPFGIYHDEYPPSRGLLEPATTLLAGLAWLAILASGWLARGTRIGLLLFGLWFYLAAHLVESTVFPLELYFEHRNYLPSVGIFFSLGYAGYLLVERARLKRVMAAAPGFAARAYRARQSPGQSGQARRGDRPPGACRRASALRRAGHRRARRQRALRGRTTTSALGLRAPRPFPPGGRLPQREQPRVAGDIRGRGRVPRCGSRPPGGRPACGAARG